MLLGFSMILDLVLASADCDDVGCVLCRKTEKFRKLCHIWLLFSIRRCGAIFSIMQRRFLASFLKHFALPGRLSMTLAWEKNIEENLFASLQTQVIVRDSCLQMHAHGTATRWHPLLHYCRKTHLLRYNYNYRNYFFRLCLYHTGRSNFNYVMP